MKLATPILLSMVIVFASQPSSAAEQHGIPSNSPNSESKHAKSAVFITKGKKLSETEMEQCRIATAQNPPVQLVGGGKDEGVIILASIGAIAVIGGLIYAVKNNQNNGK